MARRAILMIAFHGVESIYTYIYIFIFLCPLVRLCVVYVVKEVASFPGGSINKWAWHVIECALELYRSEEGKLLVAYAETETNSKLFYLKYIPKVLQGSLKGKESR